MIKIAHIIASSGISAVVGAGRVKLIAIAEDITMQVLFLATYGDFLATFELQNIKLLQQLGCTVHCASNFENKAYNRYTKNLDDIGVIKHNVVFSRSCFTASN